MSGQARVIACITLIIISLSGATAAHYLGPTILLWMKPFIEDIRHAGATGWLVFLAIQIAVSTSGFIPASLIGVAAGLAYGTYIGFLFSAAGTLGGGYIAFQLSRSLMRPFILKFVSQRPYLIGLDEDISRKGWWLVCLLRISPSMPFAATSYALGLTRIGLLPYLMSSLASLPALFGYVILGGVADPTLQPALLTVAQPLHWGLILVGAASTALLSLQVWRLIKSISSCPSPLPFRGALRPSLPFPLTKARHWISGRAVV
jgi:uncharacterized membrane protein YdjX (TVP38/TMEM64 family)